MRTDRDTAQARNSAAVTGRVSERGSARSRIPAIICALVLLAAGCGTRERPLVVLATTTSVANSGLLDQLLPVYEESAHVRVRPVPVGSGRALAMLSAAQADVIITHAPGQEAAALRGRPQWWYRKILFNDFLVAGPPDDPSRVAEASDALEAMRRIANGRVRFISRGDESGTHERERQLWKEARAVPPADLVVSAGQGMGATLNIASETGSYTLTDRGTFAHFAGKRALKELSSGDPRLLNTYAVIADSSNAEGIRLARWLGEGDGRSVLAERLASGHLRGFSLWPPNDRGDRPGDLPGSR